jgi:hypothetical protein
MFCAGCADLSVSHSTSLNKHADIGSSLSCEYTTPETVNCIFRDNPAASYGGS